MQFVEGRRLWARRLGWIDFHLLAPAMLSECGLWRLERRLSRTAREPGLRGAG